MWPTWQSITNGRNLHESSSTSKIFCLFQSFFIAFRLAMENLQKLTTHCVRRRRDQHERKCSNRLHKKLILLVLSMSLAAQLKFTQNSSNEIYCLSCGDSAVESSSFTVISSRFVQIQQVIANVQILDAENFLKK